MKMRHIFVGCLLLALAAGVSAQIYRSVDSEGNVVFTDQPTKGSERLKLKPLTVVPSVKVDSPPAEQPAVDTGVDTGSYQSFRIVDPAHDTTVRANGGELAVVLNLEPLIRHSDHRIHVFLDGQDAAQTQNTLLKLNGVDRGAHKLQAQIRDKAGNVLISTGQVSFTVLRTSVAQ